MFCEHVVTAVVSSRKFTSRAFDAIMELMLGRVVVGCMENSGGLPEQRTRVVAGDDMKISGLYPLLMKCLVYGTSSAMLRDALEDVHLLFTNNGSNIRELLTFSDWPMWSLPLLARVPTERSESEESMYTYIRRYHSMVYHHIFRSEGRSMEKALQVGSVKLEDFAGKWSHQSVSVMRVLLRDLVHAVSQSMAQWKNDAEAREWAHLFELIAVIRMFVLHRPITTMRGEAESRFLLDDEAQTEALNEAIHGVADEKESVRGPRASNPAEEEAAAKLGEVLALVDQGLVKREVYDALVKESEKAMAQLVSSKDGGALGGRSGPHGHSRKKTMRMDTMAAMAENGIEGFSDDESEGSQGSGSDVSDDSGENFDDDDLGKERGGARDVEHLGIHCDAKDGRCEDVPLVVELIQLLQQAGLGDEGVEEEEEEEEEDESNSGGRKSVGSADDSDSFGAAAPRARSGRHMADHSHRLQFGAAQLMTWLDLKALLEGLEGQHHAWTIGQGERVRLPEVAKGVLRLSQDFRRQRDFFEHRTAPVDTLLMVEEDHTRRMIWIWDVCLEIMSNGSSLETNADGSTVKTYEDGSVVRTLRDGTVTRMSVDGRRETRTETDGTVTVLSLPRDGSRRGIQRTLADGSCVDVDEQGSSTARTKSGMHTVITRREMGQIQVQLDGSTIETARQSLIRNPSFRISVDSLSGEVDARSSTGSLSSLRTVAEEGRAGAVVGGGAGAGAGAAMAAALAATNGGSNPDAGIEIMEKTLAVQTTHYGDDSLQVAATLERLGECYGLQGNHTMHKDLLTQVAKIQQKHFGDDDVRVAVTKTQLGNVCGTLGDVRTRIELLDEALPVITAQFGEDDLQVATLMVNLANACGAYGNVQRQKDMLARALPVLVSNYGDDHIAVAITRYNLGNAAGALGDAEAHRREVEQCLPTLTTHYGAGHIQLALALGSLSNAYGMLGNEGKQRELLEKTLDIEVVHYGEDDLRVATTLEILARTQESGAPEESIKLNERALRVLEGKLGEGHVKTSGILCSLGVAWGKMKGGVVGAGGAAGAAGGSVAEAVAKKIVFVERALRIEEKEHGLSDLRLASLLAHLADAHGAQGDFVGQRALLERCLAIESEHHGKSHFKVATTLASLGNVFGSLGDFDKHVELLEQALELKIAHYGDGDVQIGVTLTNLGLAHGKAHDLEKKDAFLKRALAIFLLHLKEDHPYVKTARANLSMGRSPVDLQGCEPLDPDVESPFVGQGGRNGGGGRGEGKR